MQSFSLKRPQPTLPHGERGGFAISDPQIPRENKEELVPEIISLCPSCQAMPGVSWERMRWASLMAQPRLPDAVDGDRDKGSADRPTNKISIKSVAAHPGGGRRGWGEFVRLPHEPQSLLPPTPGEHFAVECAEACARIDLRGPPSQYPRGRTVKALAGVTVFDFLGIGQKNRTEGKIKGGTPRRDEPGKSHACYLQQPVLPVFSVCAPYLRAPHTSNDPEHQPSFPRTQYWSKAHTRAERSGTDRSSEAWKETIPRVAAGAISLTSFQQFKSNAQRDDEENCLGDDMDVARGTGPGSTHQTRLRFSKR
ncbi:hypothetical protein GJAV_G00192920 [Gymnothorax javanicus]|nr:hypothetical protein GJAV_G00192920 [Gymnothorax javanicus]